ncbi:helix-turn-helix transcriptional regulator [Tsukamurella soli]|uniref:YafY family protein n=1 Tax=Tsukamurella soli TaxID=644556 RepID=A0ABP8J2Z3_9ACTN
MTRTAERLSRWLNLIPYFKSHPGFTFEQAAHDLGSTAKQVEKDLSGLYMCGLPGGYGGDLIEVDQLGDSVVVGFSAELERPLRLTVAEASSLLMSLRMLAATPGVADTAAVLRAFDKIAEATTSAGRDAAAAIEGGADESAIAATVRSATRNRHALRLHYYTASRDATSERVVDPIELQTVDTRVYLRAWCRTSEDVRAFRFDRIDAATELDEPAQVPDDVQPARSLFDSTPADQLAVATLRIAPAAEWVLEYHQMTVDEEADDDGVFVATMPYASEEWMTRFVVGFGGALEVIAPPSLAQAVIAQAQAGLANYR